MTYEDAVYFKLVLLCGYKDELQAYVDKALIEQDPLSDVVLKLSAVGADDKKMLSVLNEYLLQVKDPETYVVAEKQEMEANLKADATLNGEVDVTSPEFMNKELDILKHLIEDKKE